MEDYIGLVIAVENYHHSTTLRQVKFAHNDGSVFIDSLVKLGSDRAKIQYLSDNLATKTSITERINELARNALAHETIIFYYAEHGCYYNGRNLLTCVDTFPNSLSTTTIDLSEILAALDKSKSSKVIAFLDCCHSGIEFAYDERIPVSDFEADELRYEYSDAEHLTVFASCKSDEKSHADLERKHGVWSYYLIQALSGSAKQIYDGPILFSDKLQRYLTENTRQRVKMITTEKKNQTPVKFGKETKEKFIVADLSKLFEQNRLEANVEEITFETAIILVEEEDLVRNLPGFLPNHKVPKQIDSYHESWIQKIATELVRQELNEVAKSLKDQLKYKRGDIQQSSVEDGTGQLSTIEFDYVVGISQSPQRSDRYLITKRIENFKNSNILFDTEFNRIFANSFSELRFKLNRKINVPEVIDKIEDIGNPELINAIYDNGAAISTCEIDVKGFIGRIFLAERTFSIRMKKKFSPEQLISFCKRAYELINNQGQSLISLNGVDSSTDS